MLKVYFEILVIITIVIIYIYLVVRLKNEQEFINTIMNSIDFRNKVSGFYGYVICADRHTIIYELSLLREMLNRINEKEECVLVNLSNGFQSDSLDMGFIELVKINTIPSIIHIDNDLKIREIINFSYFDGMTNEEILTKIDNLFRVG